MSERMKFKLEIPAEFFGPLGVDKDSLLEGYIEENEDGTASINCNVYFQENTPSEADDETENPERQNYLRCCGDCSTCPFDNRVCDGRCEECSCEEVCSECPCVCGVSEVTEHE